MDFNISDLNRWILPAGILIAGYLVGLIFKKLITARLKRLLDATKWKINNVIFKAVESQINIWFLIIALWVAMPWMDLSEKAFFLFNRGVTALLILSISIALSQLMVGLVNLWSARQNKAFPSTLIFSNLIKIIVITIGVILILDSWDISITPFLTALGIGGLAISLALKDTLSDFFSGLHIILSEKVRPGDFVELDTGHSGNVMNITWRNTTILERKNIVVTVPNSKLSTAIIKNYDINDPSFVVLLGIGVAYESDLYLVERVTIEEAKKIFKKYDEAIKDFEPVIRYNTFDQSSINFNLVFKVRKYGDQFILTHELIKKITERYRVESIEIPFPIRTLIHKNARA